VIVAGIDTATPATVTGLLLPDGAVVEARDEPEEGSRGAHASRLLVLLERALDEGGVAWADVDRIAVGVGPGGFTGLRIGIATARALAQARGLPLVPVSSLATLAAGAGDGAVAAVIDARRGEVFAAAWDGATALVEPAATPEETAERLTAAAATGPAVAVLAAADAGVAHAAAALEAAGDLAGARRVVLTGPGEAPDLPLGVLAERGTRFVLDALDLDADLRAARALVVGTGRLDERALRGAVEGELAVRARQAGVPCHAVVGQNALDLFSTRILDLQRIVTASSAAGLEDASAGLADVI